LQHLVFFLYFLLARRLFSIQYSAILKQKKIHWRYKMGIKKSSIPNKRGKVVEAIKNGIMSGELSPGERIATIRELSNHCGVSLSVVQQAMKNLETDGFVECRGAQGFFVSEKKRTISQKRFAKNEKGHLFLCFTHHSDLVWRHNYEYYDNEREKQLLALFQYASKNPQMTFSCEQGAIAEDFFQKHPELLEDAKKMISDGRLELYGEYSIPDLNMISGESIFRDMELGLAVYKKLFNTGTNLVRMTDAFGMCGQLPQIAALCGFEYLAAGRLPNAPAELDTTAPFRWNGMDGETFVDVIDHLANTITHIGYEYNVPVIYSGVTQLRNGLIAAKELPGNAWLNYMTEETVLRPEIFSLIAELNRSGGKQIRFGNMAEFVKTFNDLPEYSGEFNPTLTGCYTTRIRNKQLVRHAENNLFKAEFVDAITGNYRDLTSHWKELMKGQFHDAVCGCHCSDATGEIHAKLDFAASAFASGASTTVVNFNNISTPQYVEADFVPAGIPAQILDNGKIAFVTSLPPCGTKEFQTADLPAGKPVECASVFDTKFFHVDFSNPDPIIINKDGKNIFPAKGFGEIVMRFDCGSMWTSRFYSTWRGKEYQKENLVSVTRGDVFYTVVTEGEILPGKTDFGNEGNHWPGFKSLTFRKEYRFFHELDIFSLKLTLDWQGKNTKIAIRFPIDINVYDSSATYETPCGSALRKPYFEVPEEYSATLSLLSRKSDYNNACGDWPALNWVNLSDSTYGLTVANNGTPGHQLTGNNIMVSLLRSGTMTADGQFTPQEEAFDCGIHEYEFSFRAHASAEMGKAYETGIMLNRHPETVPGKIPEVSAINWDAPHIALSALRPLADGSILIRLYETVGMETFTEIGGSLPRDKEFYTASPFGEIIKKLPDGKLYFRPFEIKTIVIK